MSQSSAHSPEPVKGVVSGPARGAGWFRRARGLWILLVLALSGCGGHPVVPRPSPGLSASPTATRRDLKSRRHQAPVGLVKSAPTLKALGWRSRWEWQGARRALKRLKVDFQVVDARHLDGWSGKLLVLPDVRDMAPATVSRIQQLVRQHKTRLLATYMTSYRKADNSSWSPNGFALGPELGVVFYRWVGGPPRADTLRLSDGSRIPLGRNLAMLVHTRPGAKVLARWDATKEAAVVQGPDGIYVGEDLLCPENSDSPQVLNLVARLINRLLPKAATPTRATRFARSLPAPPFEPVPASRQRIRVGLGRVSRSLVLRSPAGVWLGDRHYSWVRLEPGSDGIQMVSAGAHRLLRGPVLRLRGKPYIDLLAVRDNGTYRWSAYRGTLEVHPAGKGFRLIGEIGLEAYVAGVVPCEVPAYFPPASLKAMAVVARTFVLSRLGHYRARGYDVTDDVHSQVFGGLSKEAAATTRAVAATAGQILEYHGRPADATFCACCGGVGESSYDAWPREAPVPYLEGQPDLVKPVVTDLHKEKDLRDFIDHPPPAYGSDSGRFRWQESYPWPELTRKLAKGLAVTLGGAYHGLGRLERVKVTERTPLGRAQELTVVGSEGTYRVHGDAIRWLFSGGRIAPGGLNSTLFYLDTVNGKLVIHGGGWGHGVGMCQEGAAGRARAGESYRQILAHYYPGTTLARVPWLSARQ